jgi:HEAT repeat protein
VSVLPPPRDPSAPVPRLVVELAGHLGRPAFVAVCTDLMSGAPRTDHLEELRYLTGHDVGPGAPVLDEAVWAAYWTRAWGARGLLHVWDDGATDAVVAGLDDEHWRPAETCLKVSARHAVAGTGDGAARLAAHAMPRMRAQAVRALGVVGDTEHVGVVRARLEDGQPWVRRHAARALERMADRLDLGEEAW